MDQDNTKGQDKRNWRERLGIGAQAGKDQAAARDLPRMTDDAKPAPAVRPAVNAKVPPRGAPVAGRAPAAPVSRPAPMAPRANPRPAVTAPVSPDKLAERLRSQREASTKLAEQRVQVARQRADAAPPPPAPMPTRAPPPPPAPVPQARPAVAAAKPKFTFAEEGDAPAAPVRAPAPPPPQLQPARPPLGAPAQPAFQQRPPTPAYQPQQPMPGYPPAGGFQTNYSQQPVPPYRPIDPATGYPQQQGYVPQQRGFNPPPPNNYAPVPGPRLNMPPRPNPGLNPNLQMPPDYAAPPPITPGAYTGGQRINRPPARGPIAPTVGPEGYDEEEYYDEVPQPRGGARPSSTDYQQAYRDAEYGYEEELPRSKTPWILAGLILSAMLIAGGLVWAYQSSSLKSLLGGQAAQRGLPTVTAPETPAKVQAEQPAAEVPVANGEQPAPAPSPTKKKIYDRIVGDQEVLGGEVAAPVEEPAAIPAPVNGTETPPQPQGGGGEDAAPLPIPPPPGSGDQQGTLDPALDKKSAETITPAAGESQAAVAAQVDDLPVPAATPPAPGDTAEAAPLSRSIVPEPAAKPVETEKISDAEEPVAAPKKKLAAAEKKAPKAKEKTEKLGAKPVVLVPPSAKAKVAAAKTPNTKIEGGSVAVAGDGGLYGTTDITTASPAPAPAPTAPEGTVKKKRTLADLFAGTKEDDPAPAEVDVAAVDPPAAKQAPALKKAQTPAPKLADAKPVEVASAGGGFVVQLASFRTKAEASTEYSRLKAKHSGALARFQPIISEATVAGSTRFRLSVGTMENQAQANAVCASLFAGGERDCLVKKR